MADLDLDALAAALAAVKAPRPWSVDREFADSAICHAEDGYITAECDGAEADLIVAAVNALPTLLAAARERDELRVEVERLRDVEAAVRGCEGDVCLCGDLGCPMLPIAEALDAVSAWRLSRPGGGER